MASFFMYHMPCKMINLCFDKFSKTWFTKFSSMCMNRFRVGRPRSIPYHMIHIIVYGNFPILCRLVHLGIIVNNILPRGVSKKYYEKRWSQISMWQIFFCENWNIVFRKANSSTRKKKDQNGGGKRRATVEEIMGLEKAAREGYNEEVLKVVRCQSKVMKKKIETKPL